MDNQGKQISKLYQDTIQRLAVIFGMTKRDAEVFYLAQNPAIRRKIDEEMSRFARAMLVTIEMAAIKGWIDGASTETKAILNTLGNKAKPFTLTAANYHQTKASTYVKSLKNRLSDNVWKATDQFRTEIELTLQLGIKEGRSAALMAGDLKKYLNDPERLFRRVRDEFGNLHLSKNAANYKPGRGKYRSSYKNARRLAVTETNIAYEMGAHAQRQENPCVVGIEIQLSNNHPISDICDTLAGKYPKDFVFTKWHPHCRCTCTSILVTDEEMDKLLGDILDGDGDNKVKSTREVVTVPDNYVEWGNQNKDRIIKAKKKDTLPYFVSYNKKYNPIAFPKKSAVVATV